MKNNKVFIWSVTVALAGFLFGVDTAVISGADKPIQALWKHSDLFHGFFIMSMALWGTVVGALFGGIPCEQIGRKKTLIWIGVLYFVSAIGSGLAWDPYSFSFFRFIGGLGVGASSVAAPTYISEISPADKRGRLVILYQFNIVAGILAAFLSNYYLAALGDESWRWMLGVVAIPSFIYLVMVLGVPESPRWLLLRKRDASKAQEILMLLYTAGSAEEENIARKHTEEEIRTIQKGITESDNHDIFSGRFRIPLMLAFLLAFFNQLSGINFVIYYAPRIFEEAGLGTSAALLSSAGIGLINLFATFLGMYLIDRAGRKTLMLVGSIGYIVSLSLVSWAFFEGNSGSFVPYFVFLFIASHAVGQGAVIWVFISEIFPNRVRAFGQAFGSSVHWVFAALITLLMPYVLSQFKGGPIFAFFALMMVLQLLFVIFMMPETKGVPLEELEKRFRG
ncbi:MAG: sugar porter family MFS transporter [Microscillaceae bacterium]|nr:sugar porter family MFS transporter [Microscillaceae bacterium]